MKLFFYIIAFCCFVAATIAYYLNKKNASPFEEVINGKICKRRIQMCKGEVQNLSLSQSGDGYINTLVPTVKGTADLQLSPDLLDTFAKKIEMQKEGNSVPTKILLMLMQVDDKNYIVRIPSGKKIFLGEATILSNKKAKDEYDFKDLVAIEDKIKPVLYNRNALLICAAVCLLIGHTFVSLLLSSVSIYLSLKYRLFSPLSIDGTPWVYVDTSKYPQPAADKPEFQSTRAMSEAAKKVQEIVDNLPGKKNACKNCGTLLDDENWQFCPHCGQPVMSEIPEDDVSDDFQENNHKYDDVQEDANMPDEDFPDDLAQDLDGMSVDEMSMDGDMPLDDSFTSDESFSPEDESDGLEDSDDTFIPDEETDDVEDEFSSDSDDGDIDFLNVDDLPEPEDFRGESPDGLIDADYRVVN